MTTITFQMTPQEYYAGWKYRAKADKNALWFIKWVSVGIGALLAVLAACSVLHPFYLFAALFFAVFPFFVAFSEKKSILREFSDSPVLNDLHTLQLQNECITVINSFEKITVPAKHVYAAREDQQYFYFLPTLKKGIFVLCKARCDASALGTVMAAVRQEGV